MKALRNSLFGALLLVAALALIVYWLNVRNEDSVTGTVTPTTPTTASTATPAPVADAALIARGAYLARAGNCMGCHTATGAPAYAGGRGIPTPFGTIYAPNLTPDVATGLGAWSSAEFWRALHHGRSRDGHLLYPAFPYPNYTLVTRADSDALHAFLRSLPAVAQPNKAHDLSFPFNQQGALAVWRALYFRAAEFQPDAQQSAAWNRGAYLVEGLGHCNACHASRNALGAAMSPLDLAGGLIPVQNWYAPSLAAASEAGVAHWDTQHIVDLLKTGVAAPNGYQVAVAGPMSEVVGGGTQYLSEPDLSAMAHFLKALPQIDPGLLISASVTAKALANDSASDQPALDDSVGGKLYTQHCAACHGAQGEGAAGIYPALAGARAVAMPTPANLVHLVIEGGFPPATAGNPRPFGMPPFATVLSDAEVAQLLSYVRASWGNRSDAVTALEVARFRSAR